MSDVKCSRELFPCAHCGSEEKKEWLMTCTCILDQMGINISDVSEVNKNFYFIEKDFFCLKCNSQHHYGSNHQSRTLLSLKIQDYCFEIEQRAENRKTIAENLLNMDKRFQELCTTYWDNQKNFSSELSRLKTCESLNQLIGCEDYMNLLLDNNFGILGELFQIFNSDKLARFVGSNKKCTSSLELVNNGNQDGKNDNGPQKNTDFNQPTTSYFYEHFGNINKNQTNDSKGQYLNELIEFQIERVFKNFKERRLDFSAIDIEIFNVKEMWEEFRKSYVENEKKIEGKTREMAEGKTFEIVEELYNEIRGLERENRTNFRRINSGN